MNGPSEHLSWNEVACWNRLVKRHYILAQYPLDWRDTRLPVLAAEFEAVRAALALRVGREIPLTVNSAYRTVAYNARLEGASKQSQHIEGRALDIRPTDGGDLLDTLYEVVLARAQSAKIIRGVGRYNSFVHMDTRPTAGLATWDLRS